MHICAEQACLQQLGQRQAALVVLNHHGAHACTTERQHVRSFNRGLQPGCHSSASHGTLHGCMHVCCMSCRLPGEVSIRPSMFWAAKYCSISCTLQDQMCIRHLLSCVPPWRTSIGRVSTHGTVNQRSCSPNTQREMELHWAILQEDVTISCKADLQQSRHKEARSAVKFK